MLRAIVACNLVAYKKNNCIKAHSLIHKSQFFNALGNFENPEKNYFLRILDFLIHLWVFYSKNTVTKGKGSFS